MPFIPYLAGILFMDNKKEKKRYRIRLLVCLTGLFGAFMLCIMAFGCAQLRAENTQNFSDVIVSVNGREQKDMITFTGLDCDEASLMNDYQWGVSLYVANARFIPGMEEERCLMTAHYTETGIVEVKIAGDAAGDASFLSPSIQYVIDCDADELISIESIPADGKEISLGKTDLIRLGRLSNNLLQIGIAAEELRTDQKEALLTFE